MQKPGKPIKRSPIPKAGRPTPKKRLRLEVAHEIDALRNMVGETKGYGFTRAEEEIISRVNGILAGNISRGLSPSDLTNLRNIRKRYERMRRVPKRKKP